MEESLLYLIAVSILMRFSIQSVIWQGFPPYQVDNHFYLECGCICSLWLEEPRPTHFMLIFI